MNTTQLADIIRQDHGFTQAASRRILRTVLGTIRNEIKQGNRVRLRDFGTFESRISHGQNRCKFDDSKNFFTRAKT